MHMRIAMTAVALAAVVAGAAEPIAKDFGWRADYAVARSEARRTGKPLLVVFRCER